MSEQIVYVGSKPILAYVTAIMTSFNNNPEKVILKARGRSISSAVDAAEVTRNRFLSDLTSEISIGTEEMQGADGGPRNVSTIEIILRRNKDKPEK
ncbi:DNA-binding protein Alba [Patescibacteria group bacterium]|nr:DNA-binding protein Alba [Patescibacteria group bacterium]